MNNTETTETTTNHDSTIVDAPKIDLARYVQVLWKWAWLIVLAVGIAGGISYRVTSNMPKIYQSSTTVMIGDEVTNPHLAPSDIMASQQIANGYVNVIQRQANLEATIKALALPMTWQGLRAHLLVTHTDGTQYITISSFDTDPQRAKLIADEVARQLILLSPTSETVAQAEQRQQFEATQLSALETEIQQAEKDLVDTRAKLSTQTSARSVLDTQDQIRALEDKLTSWRASYSSLLSTTNTKLPNAVTVIESATVPIQPVSPNVRANVLAACAIALLLAIVAILLIEYLHNMVTTAEDVARALHVPVLGVIEHMGRLSHPANAFVVARNPSSSIAEAYRFLRTSLHFAGIADGSMTVLVTSPGPREGKSVTCINLAANFAQAGKRVILVDADLRNPGVNTFLNIPNDLGLSSLLSDSNPEQPTAPAVEGQTAASKNELGDRLRSALQSTNIPGLVCLTSGPIPDNPAELLGSARMDELLTCLKAEADVVVLDSPPVLPVADASILAGRGMGVILVAESGRTPLVALRQAGDILSVSRARILGVVLNKVPKASVTYYRYPYRPQKREGSDSRANVRQ